MVKSFKGYVPATPVEFDLESPDGARTVHIRCKPSVPGSRFLDFMANTSGSDDYAGMSRAVKDVLNAAIADEDQPAFWGFCDDPNNGISIEGLSEIAGWLSEQFAGERPTQPSAPSLAS
jgi:hypothetical protein